MKEASGILLVEIVGWYGALAILAAFGLVSFGMVPADGIFYQLLNFTGAIGIIVVSAYKHVYQSIALNSIWGVIALVALIRLLI